MNDWHNWAWINAHLGELFSLTGQHLYMALLPVLLGLVLAVPLGWIAYRFRPLRTFLVTVSSLLYTIPSLALFVILPIIIGAGYYSPINVVVALTLYTLALLVRSVVDALDSLPDTVLKAANAMGFRPLRRFFAVDLPLAVPVLIAGLRVATVSNISLVSVAAAIGVNNIGNLFVYGLSQNFATPILLGIVVTVILALLADAALVLTGRALTPWTRAGRSR
jgi:osmoprotectant transport system permease protein